MAADKKLSPEKQLLDLIEKPAQQTVAAATIRYQTQAIVTPAVQKNRVAFAKNRFGEFLKAGGLKINIQTLNIVLAFVVLALVVVFVVNLWLSIAHLNKKLDLAVEAQKSAGSQASQVSSFLKAASYYLEKARGRDIFSLGVKKMPFTQTMTPSDRAVEATKHLRLVGISWSDDPDVMIEDTKTNRTLFLKKGKMIDNEVKVEAVFKDKIIVSYGGEELELR